jgi:hypothetical protein
MRLAAALAYFACLGFAQSGATLDAIRYPLLAEFAEVQGDVLVSAGKVISGPPLLRETALQLHAPQTEILFHFILSDAVLSTRIETIKKGDALGRFSLRLFRMSATKKIEIRQCTDGANPPDNRIDSTKNPLEVWIYGKTRCAIVD